MSIFDKEYVPYTLYFDKTKELDINDPEYLLEAARAALIKMKNAGAFTGETQAAILNIEQALLHVDHFKRRRAGLGIYTLTLPELDDAFDIINRTGQKEKVIVKLGVDTKENGIVILGEETYLDSYPSAIVPMLRYIIRFAVNTSPFIQVKDTGDEFIIDMVLLGEMSEDFSANDIFATFKHVNDTFSQLYQNGNTSTIVIHDLALNQSHFFTIKDKTSLHQMILNVFNTIRDEYGQQPIAINIYPGIFGVNNLPIESYDKIRTLIEG